MLLYLEEGFPFLSIEVQLVYNTVLVSGVQYSDSVVICSVCVCLIFCLFICFLPFFFFFFLGRPPGILWVPDLGARRG